MGIIICDKAGQEYFKSLIPSYLKNANCFILTYDKIKKVISENIEIINIFLNSGEDAYVQINVYSIIEAKKQ